MQQCPFQSVTRLDRVYTFGYKIQDDGVWPNLIADRNTHYGLEIIVIKHFTNDFDVPLLGS